MNKNVSKTKGFPERLSRQVIYESDYVCLYADRVRMPSGEIVEKYHQVHYPCEAVCIVIFNDENKILMIRERRYTIGRMEWEIPAGKIEEGETKEEAARREAAEESGCVLKDLRFLCSQNPANGLSDCVCHVFAGRVAEERDIEDTDEVDDKRWFSIEEVKEMLKKNETMDGVAMLGILYALSFYL